MISNPERGRDIDLLVLGAGMAGLAAFNVACEGGRLHPARALDPAPLVDPPYYTTELVPAITFTFGGVLIDRQARALDGFGNPIPGLLAAGADAGGLWFRAYAGGIATALVFGLQAAETALESVGIAGISHANRVSARGGQKRRQSRRSSRRD